MSGQRIIVLEANEVPPRIFRWYAERHPDSAIAGLVAGGGLTETENHDLSDLGGRELYPSQAWATLATGVPFSDHGVYWYGDPKPAEFPLYWQLAARAGKRVGIVGTLHSSPLDRQAGDPNVVFAIPDCFATDSATHPARYRSFQRLNLAMTRGSGRVVAAKPGLRDLATLATSWRLGVRPRSYVDLARLGFAVGTRRAPKERLRAAQFVLQSDIFLSLVRRHDPDVAVLFTNHVASMMHRYWYALFPQEWPDVLYDEAWVERHRGEIEYAMRLLDRTIGELRRLCDQSGRALVVTSAMGQAADTVLQPQGRFAVVRDAERFVAAFSDTHVAVLSGMVPQVSAVYANDAAARSAQLAIDARGFDGLTLTTDRAGDVLTFTYDIDATRDGFTIDGRFVSFADAGVESHDVVDHRSAQHEPVGSLIVHGIRLGPDADAAVDVLRVAPTILEALGVDPVPHHRTSLLPDEDRVPA
jgi:hypothetical protein